MAETTLLEIQNHHAAACGTPPSIDTRDPNLYTGYFVGPHGDQWVFAYDRRRDLAWLAGGDVSWQKFQVWDDGIAPDLVLGLEETLWLGACWKAATGRCWLDEEYEMDDEMDSD